MRVCYLCMFLHGLLCVLNMLKPAPATRSKVFALRGNPVWPCGNLLQHSRMCKGLVALDNLCLCVCSLQNEFNLRFRNESRNESLKWSQETQKLTTTRDSGAARGTKTMKLSGCILHTPEPPYPTDATSSSTIWPGSRRIPRTSDHKGDLWRPVCVSGWVCFFCI